MRGLGLNAQPLIITLAVWSWVLNNRQSIFDTEGITELTNRFCTAPKVAELPVTVRIDSRPDDVDYGYVLYLYGCKPQRRDFLW